MSIKVSVIIPNWNGLAFLSKCIKAVLKSCEHSRYEFEVLLMDDASTDNSGFAVKNQFPQIQFHRFEKNLGFGQMVNRGAQFATGDVLVLVNNDLIPQQDFINQLCRHFIDSQDLFGVSGKTVDWDNGDPNHVNMRGIFANGTLQLTWSDDLSTIETMFLQGGSCAVNRTKFLELGGLCDLYAPAYWEDYDLSYQALKSGFKNLYEPAAVGSHLGQGSMVRAYGHESVEFFKARNRHLLLALNLTDDDLQREFWQKMPGYIKNGTDARFKARLAVLRYLLKHRTAIQQERARRYARQSVTDAEIFKKFGGLGNLC